MLTMNATKDRLNAVMPAMIVSDAQHPSLQWLSPGPQSTCRPAPSPSALSGHTLLSFHIVEADILTVKQLLYFLKSGAHSSSDELPRRYSNHGMNS